jgi:glutamate-ammonia-ligase adenylyltransferase
MHDGHPNKTELFDVKHDEGGMVDVEFIVQYLVLQYSAKFPQLVNNFGNIKMLEMASDAGLIPKTWRSKCRLFIASIGAFSTSSG